MVKIDNASVQPEKAFRHGNQIFVTRNITEKTDEEENVSYNFEVYTFPPAPLKDIDQYLLDNYSAIRQTVILAHWPQEKQNEAVTESAMGLSDKIDSLKTFITDLKTEFPKE